MQAAKEILAEVFDIRTSDVDEIVKHRHEEKMEWPREFCILDYDTELIDVSLLFGF